MCLAVTDSRLSLQPLSIERLDAAETGAHTADEIAMNRITWWRESVVREFPLACDFDEACISQRGQMPRDCRLRKIEDFDDIADAQLTGGKQAEDAKPGRIRERLEQGVQIRDGRVGRRWIGWSCASERHIRVAEYDHLQAHLTRDGSSS